MTGPVLLDVVLVLLLVLQLLAGFREGLLVGALGLAGLIGGAVAGLALAPHLLTGWAPGLPRTLVLAGAVVLPALLGRLLLGALGARVRGRLRWRPVRVVDALLGAGAGALATVLVIWVLAGAARGSDLPGVPSLVAGSRVVAAVEGAVPPATSRLLASVWDSADASGFPRVFTALHEESILPVEPPSSQVPQTPGLVAAQRSVVKITGVARSCDRGLEGSGFVLEQRPGSALVVTNAHVVAGVERPLVQAPGVGGRHPARVVLHDPGRDVAVLEVPGLEAPALARVPDLRRGDPAVVAGYPLDGPYTLVTARVREVLEARGRDIHDTTDVTREVYAVYGTVEPGNSGGPLLTETGEVAGLVFARSLDDPSTGYVLTNDELSEALAALDPDLRTVPTGACAAA